jgi:hypothetical protein
MGPTPLRVYLGVCMAEALQDGAGAVADNLYGRFFGWLPPRNRRPGNGQR